MDNSTVALKLCMAAQASTIESLLKDNDEKSQSIQLLEKELAESQHERNQLRNAEIELKNLNSKLEVDKQNIDAKNTEYTQRLLDLSSEKNILEKTVYSLKDTISKIQEERDDYKLQIEDVRGDLQELDDFKEANQELIKEKEKLESQLSKYNYDLDMCQIENSKLNQRKEELEYKERELSKSNSLLQARIQEVEGGLNSKTEECANYEQMINEQKKEYEQAVIQFRAEARHKQTEYETLQQEFEAMRTILQRREAELDRWKEQDELMKTSADETANQITLLQNENRELDNQLRNAQQRNKFVIQSIQTILPRELHFIGMTDEEMTQQLMGEFHQWSNELMKKNDSMKQEVMELKNQLEGKEGVLSNVIAEQERMQLELAEKTSHLRGYEDKVNRLNSKVSEQSAIIDSLSSSNNSLELFKKKTDELEVKYIKQCENYNALVEEYDHLKAEKEQIQKEAEWNLDVLEKQKQEIQQLREQVENNSNELQQQQNTSIQNNLVISQLKEELREATERFQQADLGGQQLQQQVHELLSDCENYKRQLAEFDQYKQEMEAHQNSLSIKNQQERSTLQNKLQQLSEELALAQKEVSEVKSQLNQKNNEVSRLQNHVNDDQRIQLQKEVDVRDQQINTLQQTISEYSKKNNQLLQQIEHLEEQLNQIQLTQDTAHSSEVNFKQQQVQLLMKAIRSVAYGERSYSSLNVSLYNDSLAEISNESQSVDDAVRSLNEWSQKMVTESQMLKDRIESLENDLNQLTRQSAQQNGDMNQLRMEIERMNHEMEEKNHEMEEKNRSLVQLQQSLNEEIDRNQVLSSQVNAVNQELQASMKKVEEYSKQILDLKIQKASPSPSPLTTQLKELQQQLLDSKSALSSKELQVVTLENELATTRKRLDEAISALQLLETSLDKLKANQANPNDRLLLDQLKMEKQQAESQRDQYMQMYTSSARQVESKDSEIAQLKQLAQMKEHEYARLAAMQSTAPMEATINQYLDTIRLKDQRILQLEGDVQRLNQAKRDAEFAAVQAKQAEAYQTQFNSTQDSAVVLTLRSQLLAKQQEIASLQQQLQTEIGLVKTMKASYLELDKILSERTNHRTSSVDALLKAKEDHNQYLEKMVTSLEAELRELKSQGPAVSTPLASAVSPLLQSIITLIAPFFPESSITAASARDYVYQLCQMIQDERSLYSNLRSQFDQLQKEKGDLSQKVTMLQNYANGHNQIDKKADTFIQDLIRQRNDFEQQYKNAVLEGERKDTEVQQLRRSLKQEKETNMKLLKKKSAAPDGLNSLIEECKSICMLAKIDKNRNLSGVSDIVETLKLVRRGVASMLNLFKRENERLNFENKRLKELTETSKVNEDRINKKIKDIILVLQNQGAALREFVIAFQSIKK